MSITITKKKKCNKKMKKDKKEKKKKRIFPAYNWKPIGMNYTAYVLAYNI